MKLKKIIVAVSTMLFSCMLFCIPKPVSAITPGIKSGDTYWIVNAHSGKCLDVANTATTTGANVLQWCNNNGNNQKWQITLSPNGNYYLIKPVHFSTAFLVAETTSLSNTTNAIITTSSATPAAGWYIDVISSNGNYKITSIVNANYALTTYNAGVNNGDNVFMYTYTSGNNCNDEWILVRTSGSAVRSVDIAIQKDNSYLSGIANEQRETFSVIADATKPFYRYWHIEFRPSYYTLSSMEMDKCPRGYYTECNTTQCGAVCVNANTTPNHHKNFDYNALKAWNAYGMSGNDMRLILVNANLCHEYNGAHNTNALGWWPNGNNGMVEQNRSHCLNVRVIQHELSHTYGATHCGNAICLMEGAYDNTAIYNLNSIWCGDCRSNFNRTAY